MKFTFSGCVPEMIRRNKFNAAHSAAPPHICISPRSLGIVIVLVVTYESSLSSLNFLLNRKIAQYSHHTLVLTVDCPQRVQTY